MRTRFVTRRWNRGWGTSYAWRSSESATAFTPCVNRPGSMRHKHALTGQVVLGAAQTRVHRRVGSRWCGIDTTKLGEREVVMYAWKDPTSILAYRGFNEVDKSFHAVRDSRSSTRKSERRRPVLLVVPVFLAPGIFLPLSMLSICP